MTASKLAKEAVPEPCHACGLQKWKFAFRKSTADFWRCENCGLVRQYPLPTESQLREHYKEIHETGICSLYLQHEAMRKGIFDYWWTLLESVERFEKKGRLLDVGCSSGTHLEVAQKHGWDIYGVEPTEEAADRAQKKFGDRVFKGFLHDARYPSAHFDFVTLFDVYEHFPNPGPIFDEVSRILKPGGWMALTTADTGSLIGRMLGKHWFLYIPHEHLFYGDRRNMALFLERRGIRVRAIRRAVKQMSLEYAVGALRFLGPGLHRCLKAPLALLPASWRTKNIPLYGGEMLVMAQKLEANSP